MTDKHTSETLTGGPKQGRGNMKNRTKAEAGTGGRDSAGLTNRGSSTDDRTYGGTSRAAGLDRARTDVRRDYDDRMNAQIERNPTIAHGEGTMESRNTMTSTSSGRDTTTGPGEARRTPERSGNIYDPDQPDPHSNPKV